MNQLEKLFSPNDQIEIRLEILSGGEWISLQNVITDFKNLTGNYCEFKKEFTSVYLERGGKTPVRIVFFRNTEDTPRICEYPSKELESFAGTLNYPYEDVDTYKRIIKRISNIIIEEQERFFDQDSSKRTNLQYVWNTLEECSNKLANNWQLLQKEAKKNNQANATSYLRHYDKGGEFGIQVFTSKPAKPVEPKKVETEAKDQKDESEETTDETTDHSD